jgi:hypothetical protein
MARFGLEPQQIGIRLRQLFSRNVLCNIAGLDTDLHALSGGSWTTVRAIPCVIGVYEQSSSPVVRSEDFESAVYNLTEIDVNTSHSAEEIISNAPRVSIESYIAVVTRTAILHSVVGNQIIESSIRQELLASSFRFNVDTGLVEIRTTTNYGEATHHMRFKLDDCLVERKLDEGLCATLVQSDWKNHYV